MGDVLEARDPSRAIECVGVQLDPERVRGLLQDGLSLRRLVLCELDQGSAHGISNDLRRLAGPGLEVVVVVSENPSDGLALGATDSPVLFSHGSWDRLDRDRTQEPWAHRLPVRFNLAEDPVLREFLGPRSSLPSDPTDWTPTARRGGCSRLGSPWPCTDSEAAPTPPCRAYMDGTGPVTGSETNE